ncbi:MAG: nucleotidyl transferase AbiEii/AbiGii toxin family protein [Rhodoferax sp.]|nr:nucleotidyl transferase AbiEii/AbiGii toxin family protein [Rhodoferax sp.]
MSILSDPIDRGFSPGLSVIDRCQIAMLRELSHAHESRLILKGGLAMRVAVGSMRLTKDVDFDRAEGVSTTSVQSGVKRALQYAAQSAGLRGAEIDPGKSTETTVRMRLAGTAAGIAVRFVVEVSGRNPVPKACQTRVQVTPPSRYGMAPFVVTSYSHDMLAASKVMAVMSVNRNVPRDIYDLHDLLATHPQTILATRSSRDEWLQLKAGVLDKICAIEFAQAQQELLPYIPPDQREALNQQRWDEMTLNVAQTVQTWIAQAAESTAAPTGMP